MTYTIIRTVSISPTSSQLLIPDSTGLQVIHVLSLKFIADKFYFTL